MATVGHGRGRRAQVQGRGQGQLLGLGGHHAVGAKEGRDGKGDQVGHNENMVIDTDQDRKAKNLWFLRDNLPRLSNQAGKESNSFFKIKQLSIGRAGFLLGGGEGYLETQQRAG